MAGDGDEVSVGHLAMSDETVVRHQRVVDEPEVISQERMGRMADGLTQHGDRFAHRNWMGQHLRVGRDAHEARLRDGAGGPGLGGRCEPAPGRGVMQVVLPQQGDQQVDVEQ